MLDLAKVAEKLRPLVALWEFVSDLEVSSQHSRDRRLLGILHRMLVLMSMMTDLSKAMHVLSKGQQAELVSMEVD